LKTAFQNGANPRRLWLTARSTAKKILFHLFNCTAKYPQTLAAIGIEPISAGAVGQLNGEVDRRSTSQSAADTELAVFNVPLDQTSQISGAASRPTREGFSGSDFGQCALNVKPEGMHPSEKPLLTLTLTEEQLKHLAFAVYCQTVELQDGFEANEPEVIAAIEALNEISRLCIELGNEAQS
jgi:hypothetical protein